MNFSEKSRYDSLFQQVTHKGGESSMNNKNRFQNVQVLSVSVGNIYIEDHLMNISLGKFHQGGKYTAHISIHQLELRRE